MMVVEEILTIKEKIGVTDTGVDREKRKETKIEKTDTEAGEDSDTSLLSCINYLL